MHCCRPPSSGAHQPLAVWLHASIDNPADNIAWEVRHDGFIILSAVSKSQTPEIKRSRKARASAGPLAAPPGAPLGARPHPATALSFQTPRLCQLE